MKMHQGSGLLPLFSKVVVDVVTELASEGALSELLYAGDIMMMSEAIGVLRSSFTKWKEASESQALKSNILKTKNKVSGCITKDGLPESKTY